MKVILAQSAGFCSGVKKAIKAVLMEAESGKSGGTFGPLVHNEAVTKHLEDRGVTIVEDLEDFAGSFIAIRSHGVTPTVRDKLLSLNCRLLDLTCPRVKRVQKIAADIAAKGKNIYIFGDKNHPEVIGLVGWAGSKAKVFSSIEELSNIEITEPAALVAQTTASPAKYSPVKKLFINKTSNAEVFETICPETKLRQEEVIEMAERVEAFVVVGSESSANTRALFDRCRQIKPTCRVNNVRELADSFLREYKVLGVTAGASTPPWTIKEVVERMENESMETMKEEEFGFDEDLKVPQVGEQVFGKVARVTDDEVFVDIGAKTEAILPAAEVHLNRDQLLADLFNIEDDIEVTVLDIDEQEGKVTVSHRRLAREKRFNELSEALEQDQILEATVKQVVGAGLVMDLGNGIEGFMPGSLVDTQYIPDFNEFKDKTVNFKIIELDRDKGKLILSRKKVIEAEQAKSREETLKAIEIGSTINGVVKRLTDFGAFVDIGGIDGLVHISELSWDRINHPSDMLKVGEDVSVKVLEVIPEKERISLSLRKTQPDPWTKASEELEVGQIISGKVTRLVNFGAFVELKPGLEGLAHISQLADYHVKHPSEVLAEGEEVEVKVLEVKPKSKRISLSIKEAGGSKIPGDAITSSGSENGNVTLGDVFGDLFDNGNFSQDSSDEEDEGAQE